MFIKSVMGLILNLQSDYVTYFFVATSNLPSNHKHFIQTKKYYNLLYKGSEDSGKVGTVHNFISRKEEKMASAQLNFHLLPLGLYFGLSNQPLWPQPPFVAS